MKPEDPAFPIGAYMGLTKRELFCGMAIKGLQVFLLPENKDALKILMEKLKLKTQTDTIAKLAVMQADALIAAMAEQK